MPESHANIDIFVLNIYIVDIYIYIYYTQCLNEIIQAGAFIANVSLG